MRPELENIELIERYLQGELEQDDFDIVKSKIQNDPVFAEEVELQRILMEGATNDGLRKILNHIHYSEYDNPLSYFIRSWWKYIGGGALLIICFAIGGYYFKPAEHRENNSKYSMVESGILSVDKAKKNEISLDSDPYIEDVPRLALRYRDNIFASEPYNEENLFQYFYIDHRKDTTLSGSMGSKIKIPANSFLNGDGLDADGNVRIELKEIYKKSDIVLYDFNHPSDNEFHSSGKVYLNAVAKGKDLKINPDKNIELEFNSRGALHVSESDFYFPEVKKREEPVTYFKMFDPLPERRIIVLPAVVLDYDIIYTRNEGDKLMNERIESLLLPEYENAFTSTTQFHYRIEGCQLYGKKTELLDIYLNNIHLKLWEADSLVENYLVEKASTNCADFTFYMKAAEYFRWLKSLKHGKPERYAMLDYRNYRKGQFFNKLPDKILEKYLSRAGLSAMESDELINYFKKMFYYKKMFYKQIQIVKSDKSASLDYYYKSEGSQEAFPLRSCDDKKELASANQVNYLYLAGNSFGGAVELNQFMQVDNLGWINCDWFVNFKKTCSLNASVINNDSVVVSKFYLVFKDYNSVMGGKWSKKGEYFFERLPHGIPVWLIVLGYNGNRIYYGKKEVLTGITPNEFIEMNPVTEEELKKDLVLMNR